MTREADPTLTDLLADLESGDPNAVGRIFSSAYDQLRVLARIQRRRLPPTATLNTTALVHEAFLKLGGAERERPNDRAHFMAIAATAMRYILISHARRALAAKRGAGASRTPLDEADVLIEGPGHTAVKPDTLIALDDALERLGCRSDRQRRVVECRFFGGMSIEETAIVLGVSRATVKRDWSLAQAWLYRELQEAEQ